MQQISPAKWLASQPEIMAEKLSQLSPEAQAALKWTWRGWWARPNQLAPEGDWWDTWMVLSGRGFGKTRSGTEWVREKWRAGAKRIALVAETAADARDVLVEGNSGLLAISPKHERPLFEPSKRRLTWPNGAIATLYNGTEPDQLRGPEHDTALVDELAKYKQAQATWDNLQFGLRIGDHPQVMVTTTPRPIPIIRDIIAEPRTIVTRGSTFDNSDNLTGTFLKRIRKKYEGTRLGRQELFAEILDDLPGALWTQEVIEKNRVKEVNLDFLKRIVIGIDPSGTKGEEDDGDTIGIVGIGLGMDDELYVIADGSVKGSPIVWASRAIQMYRDYRADRIVAEVNFGGAMVGAVIQNVDPNVSYKAVTASRGKVVRAEPIAALYEQGKVHHVGNFPEMEDQMVHMSPSGFVGRGSPDRVDALVWAATDLMVLGNFEWYVGA